MQRQEIVALGDIADHTFRGANDRMRDVHKGIAQRVWANVPASAPVRIVHDLIVDGVYTAVGRSIGTLARATALTVAASQPQEGNSIQSSPAARAALGALNGMIGDSLAQRGNPLALPMTLRVGQDDVELERAALAGAYPDATDRLAVFIHGLFQTEDAWTSNPARGAPFGLRLREELGYTALYVRYNTGRPAAENGRELARLLDKLVELWPTDVTEIALIAHSTGGLVARSACRRATTAKLRHVVMLGAPHRGVPVERVVSRAATALARLPETRALAATLDRRSAGIKELRRGSDTPFLPRAKHYFVSAGKLAVPRSSAWAHGGRGERLEFPVDHYAHVDGVGHLDLLNHPAVYAQLRRWLANRPALPQPQRP
jgi:hypothetical protein